MPTTTRLYPSGAWEGCDLIGGVFVRRTYYGFTKREAVTLFRQECAQ